MVRKVNDEFKQAFAKRFQDACADNPRIPPLNRGLYRYIADRMTERGVPTSHQAVQKWFSGLAVPGRDRMVHLADIVGSDPDYLLIGTTAQEVKPPAVRVMERNGALNLLIGTLEMQGVHCALSDGEDSADIFAMKDGRMTKLLVRGISEPEGSSTFMIPKDHYRSKLVVVWINSKGVASFHHVPADMIEQHGEGSRDTLVLEAAFSGDHLFIGAVAAPKLSNPLEILN